MAGERRPHVAHGCTDIYLVLSFDLSKEKKPHSARQSHAGAIFLQPWDLALIETVFPPYFRNGISEAQENSIVHVKPNFFFGY